MIKVLNLTPKYPMSEDLANQYVKKLLKFHSSTARQLVIHENIYYFHLKDGTVLCPENSDLRLEEYFTPLALPVVKELLRKRLPRNYKG